MTDLEAWLRLHQKTQADLADELLLAQASIARAVAGKAGKKVAAKIAARTGLDSRPMMGLMNAPSGGPTPASHTVAKG